MGTSRPGEKFLHELDLKQGEMPLGLKLKRPRGKARSIRASCGLPYQQPAAPYSISFHRMLNSFQFR
jgi:hypothetical protein